MAFFFNNSTSYILDFCVFNNKDTTNSTYIYFYICVLCKKKEALSLMPLFNSLKDYYGTNNFTETLLFSLCAVTK